MVKYFIVSHVFCATIGFIWTDENTVSDLLLDTFWSFAIAGFFAAQRADLDLPNKSIETLFTENIFSLITHHWLEGNEHAQVTANFFLPLNFKLEVRATHYSAKSSFELRSFQRDDSRQVAELVDDWELARWTSSIPHPRYAPRSPPVYRYGSASAVDL